MSAFGMEIRLNQFLPPGTMVAHWMTRTLYVRHESDLTVFLLMARWHPDGGACPTATNADDCRCMLGEEA